VWLDLPILDLPRDAGYVTHLDRPLHQLGDIDSPGPIRLFDHELCCHRHADERELCRCAL